ncbi:hypothetical protein CsSME_00010887 [Camellia sinensis var. sinensis]
MGKLQKRFEKAATWENLVTPTIKKKLDEVVFKSNFGTLLEFLASKQLLVFLIGE